MVTYFLDYLACCVRSADEGVRAPSVNRLVRILKTISLGKANFNDNLNFAE